MLQIFWAKKGHFLCFSKMIYSKLELHFAFSFSREGGIEINTVNITQQFGVEFLIHQHNLTYG